MATEYKLPYTASDINRRLGKVDEIDSLKDLVGTTPVPKQISDAIKNIGVSIKTDTTLKVRGMAADAKAVGDAIENAKVTIDGTLKVSGRAADAKVTGDEIAKLNNLVGNTPVADQITTAIEELEGSIYEHPDTHPASMITGLSSVATSGDYNDLSNLPEQYIHPESHPASMITGLADVATSGNYEDLSNKPIIPEGYTHPETHPADMITGLSDVAVSGNYEDLKNKPTIPDEYVHPSTHSVDMITGLADIATSGDYNDLVNKPTIPNEYTHPESHPASMITGLSDVATSGSYNDLTDKPTIPSIDGLATVDYVDEQIASVGGSGDMTKQVQADWNCTDEDSPAYIKNKPVISGDGGVSVQADWNQNDPTKADYIKNKPFGEMNDVVDLLPLIQFTNFTLDTNFPLYAAYGNANYSLTVGEIYIVYWDDVRYECIAQDGSSLFTGSIILGNVADFGLSGKSEPFAIGVVAGVGVTYYSLTDQEAGSSHKVRIAQETTIINKIDQKFIPEVSGLPEVTESDNNKVLQVVNGKWEVVAVSDSVMATYVEDYINSALEGEY